MRIEEKKIYEIERRQFVGYDHTPLTLTTGETLPFVEYKSGYEPTCEVACNSFDAMLPQALVDMMGVVLWRDEPKAYRDLKGWFVHCRLAVTEDMRFTDAALIVSPEVKYPGKHKTQAMTVEEMLHRT